MSRSYLDLVSCLCLVLALTSRSACASPQATPDPQAAQGTAIHEQYDPTQEHPKVQKEKTPSGIVTNHTREDYAKLTLEGSDLKAATPLAGGHEENADFVRDLYQVQWRAGDPIDLYIIRPAKVKNPPVVVYLYGFPTDSSRFLNAGYCRRVVHNGSAAVGFVSALTGDRATNRPMKQWFISELPQSLSMSVHDVQMVLNYLQTRNDLDLKHVGIFGEGSGGAIAVLAAAADPRIKAIDLIDPWGDWPNFLAKSTLIPESERPDYVKPAFLKKLETLEPTRYLPDLKDRSIRLQLVEEGKAAPDVPVVKAPDEIEQAMPTNAKVIHYKTNVDFYTATSGGRLFEWISNQLKPTPQGAAHLQAGPGKESGGAIH